MKRNGFILIALALGCLNSRGQTNDSPAPAFSLPSPQLRTRVEPKSLMNSSSELGSGLSSSSFKPKHIGSDTALAVGTNAATELITVSRPRILDSQTYRYLDENGYLTRPASKSDNGFVRFMSSTFEPEVFHIGKTPATCSIYTAIKHRNPLCLLNPLILSVSW